MVTHDAYAASFADRILILKDGCIIQELLKQNAGRRAFYESIAQTIAKLDTER
jgi:putative ABC transport system ATP-binding protein